MPRTLDRRIDYVDIDEDRKIVTLKPGYEIEEPNTPSACHVFGADTYAEIRKTMKQVTPCTCAECKKLAAQ
jgi:hypothetical protein